MILMQGICALHKATKCTNTKYAWAGSVHNYVGMNIWRLCNYMSQLLMSFSYREDANKAIQRLDKHGYDNLILRVEWAQPRAERT